MKKIKTIFSKKKLPIILGALLALIVAGILFSFADKKDEPQLQGIEIQKILGQTYSQPMMLGIGGRTITIQPLEAKNPSFEQKGGQYTYKDAYEKTDVIQTLQPYAIKEELVLKETGHPLEFQYKIGNADNYKIEKDGKGNINFYDKEKYVEGQELNADFTIPAPFIKDNNGNKSTSAVTTLIDGDLLMIIIDAEWLKTAVYPVILDPTIEINIINVHSHPRQGDNWIVEFTTKGKADLKIIPNDQATINDDEFLMLTCDGVGRDAQILAGDVIYYLDWECDGIGKVVHYTKTAGKHTLRFEFGGETAFAYNNPGTRAKTVQFWLGQYSTTGTSTDGQDGATSQSFTPYVNIELAEKTVSVKSAFVVFEAQLAGVNDAGDINGFELGFDACAGGSTPDIWTGSGAVNHDQSASKTVEGETTPNNNTFYLRVLFNVTSETQLGGYVGGDATGSYLTVGLGYWIDSAVAAPDADLINSAKAKIYITYTYDDTGNSSTNTVIYPLESLTNLDKGTKTAAQTTDCTRNSNCPLFSYYMAIPEFSASVSKWFEVSNFNDANLENDVRAAIDIQDTDTSSSVFVLEAAQTADQSNQIDAWWDGVPGFTENTSQSMEYYASHSVGSSYLIGGEVVETYIASASAAKKTKTISFPIGVVTNGSTATGAEASTTVFFPETGVEIQSAWFRILVTADDANTATTINVATKVGDNAFTSSTSYAYNSGSDVYRESFKIFHVIASGAYAGGSDYDELDNASAVTGKTIILGVDSSTATSRAISAELMITYTYTGEAAGYMTSLSIFGGQTTGAATSVLWENAATSNAVLPEITGTKTLRGAIIKASWLLSDSDSTCPAASGFVDTLMGTSAPTCNAVPSSGIISNIDGVPAFIEVYESALAQMVTTDNQAYTICYRISRHTETNNMGAKMNGILVYTYQWDAPVIMALAHYRWRNDDGNESAANWKEGQDQPTTMKKSQNIRLRFSIKNTGGDGSGYQFGLQIAPRNGSSCDAVASTSYTPVPPAGSCGVDVACMTDSTYFTSGAAATAQLTSEGIWIAGEMVDNATSISDAIDIGPGYYTEVEYNFQFTTNATEGAAYCLRLTNNGALLDTYTKIAETDARANVNSIFRLKGNTRIKGSTRLK